MSYGRQWIPCQRRRIDHVSRSVTFLCLAEELIGNPSTHSNDCFDASSTYFSLQQFVYTSGSTKIRVAPNSLSTTDYCVDFGSDRGVNGVGLKIWQCYDGLPAQQLYITGDNHIAVEGDNQCADVKAESQASQAKPYGSLKDVQSWQCSGGNPNQVGVRFSSSRSFTDLFALLPVILSQIFGF